MASAKQTFYSIQDGKVVSRRAVNKRDDEFNTREEAEASLTIQCATPEQSAACDSETQEDAEVRRADDDNPVVTSDFSEVEARVLATTDKVPELKVDPDRPVGEQVSGYITAVGRRLTPKEMSFWAEAIKERRLIHEGKRKTIQQRQANRAARRKAKRALKKAAL